MKLPPVGSVSGDQQKRDCLLTRLLDRVRREARPAAPTALQRPRGLFRAFFSLSPRLSSYQAVSRLKACRLASRLVLPPYSILIPKITFPAPRRYGRPSPCAVASPGSIAPPLFLLPDEVSPHPPHLSSLSLPLEPCIYVFFPFSSFAFMVEVCGHIQKKNSPC